MKSKKTKKKKVFGFHSKKNRIFAVRQIVTRKDGNHKTRAIYRETQSLERQENHQGYHRCATLWKKHPDGSVSTGIDALRRAKRADYQHQF